MSTRKRKSGNASRTQWLEPEQSESWKELTVMLSRLPTVLEAQLRRTADLSCVEYAVLDVLTDSPQHTMRMSNLAVLTNTELSRLSHLVGRLERRGLVRREPDPTDGRFTHAILTKEGHEHLVTAAPSHVGMVRDLVMDVLTDEELADLRHCVRLINARLDERLGRCGTEARISPEEPAGCTAQPVGQSAGPYT